MHFLLVYRLGFVLLGLSELTRLDHFTVLSALRRRPRGSFLLCLVISNSFFFLSNCIIYQCRVKMSRIKMVKLGKNGRRADWFNDRCIIIRFYVLKCFMTSSHVSDEFRISAEGGCAKLDAKSAPLEIPESGQLGCLYVCFYSYLETGFRSVICSDLYFLAPSDTFCAMLTSPWP